MLVWMVVTVMKVVPALVGVVATAILSSHCLLSLSLLSFPPLLLPVSLLLPSKP